MILKGLACLPGRRGEVSVMNSIPPYKLGFDNPPVVVERFDLGRRCSEALRVPGAPTK